MSDDKRCGTCKWFRKYIELISIGRCTYPAEKIPIAAEMLYTEESEGTTCPCWEVKQ